MIRDVLGIKKRREYSPEELARLQEQGRLLAASQSKQGAGITPPVASETGGRYLTPPPMPNPQKSIEAARRAEQAAGGASPRHAAAPSKKA
jgi:hypothetical protein